MAWTKKKIAIARALITEDCPTWMDHTIREGDLARALSGALDEIEVLTAEVERLSQTCEQAIEQEQAQLEAKLATVTENKTLSGKLSGALHTIDGLCDDNERLASLSQTLYDALVSFPNVSPGREAAEEYERYKKEADGGKV